MSNTKSIQLNGEYQLEQWKEVKKNVMEANDDFDMHDHEILEFLFEWFNEGKVYALADNE